MSLAVKNWYDKVGSGTPLEAPSAGVQTPLDASGLRDLETRLGAYTDITVAASAGSGGTTGGTSVLVIDAGDPVPNPLSYPEGTLLITVS